MSQLRSLTMEHPLRERLAALLMLALHREGRQADALEHYRRVRSRLAEELGVDPGSLLRRVHQRVLTAELPDESVVVNFPGAAPPRQLPPPVQFVGKERELAALDSATRAGSAAIAVIVGAGGIGKTWLALHWAHRNVRRFPDGHLFVDLRGFDPTEQPMSPEAAVLGFLDALGVSPAAIPAAPDAQAALYRRVLTDKRVLVVLDNARDTDQVLPLLPGPSCTVLVTSRHQLGGLVAAHGAQPVAPDVLTDTEARELLATRLGQDRIAAEPEAVVDLLADCAGFPLPLGIVAARARLFPQLPLSLLAAELNHAASRLNALDTGDRRADFRAALSWSYKALDADAAEVFRLLGVAPGPDIGLSAAAGLMARSMPTTRNLLRRLEQVHLVQQYRPGRYRTHDLIKLYAHDRAVQDHFAEECEAALSRLVDHYVHTAFAAERLLNPRCAPFVLDPPVPGSRPDPPPDRTAALRWFETERLNLLAAQQTAVEREQHGLVWQLAWSLSVFHTRRGHRPDEVVAWRTGVDVTEWRADPVIRNRARRLLDCSCAGRGGRREAVEHLQHALVLVQCSGDPVGQAHTHRALAWAWGRQGDDERALEHSRRALRLFQSLDLPVGQVEALNWVTWLSSRLGAHGQVHAYCHRAPDLHHDHQHREGEATTLEGLGRLAHQTGRYAEARGFYQQALVLCRDLGIIHQEADLLDGIGQAYAAGGRDNQARIAWQHALELYRAQHRLDDVERVRRRLITLTDDPAAHGRAFSARET
ncbi:ATP-binding protein [Saccharothrix lopnurensis]|uniref:ATP-binding protein n=1 Tax=Saccharothrix lopnurensis TaxID=1670621 RepID=A0ABW1PH45_9PSEU